MQKKDHKERDIIKDKLTKHLKRLAQSLVFLTIGNIVISLFINGKVVFSEVFLFFIIGNIILSIIFACFDFAEK